MYELLGCDGLAFGIYKKFLGITYTKFFINRNLSNEGAKQVLSSVS